MNDDIQDFATKVGEHIADAKLRFKLLIKIRSAMTTLQKSFPIGSEDYKTAEKRKNMWLEMLTRVKQEVMFLSKVVGAELTEAGYAIDDSGTSDKYDIEFDINDIGSMKELYIELFNITTTRVYVLTQLAINTIAKLDDSEPLKARMSAGIDRFNTVIKSCIMANYVNQKTYMGDDVDKEEVHTLFKETPPDEVDKVLI